MGRGGRLGVEAETQGTVNLWQSSGSREECGLAWLRGCVVKDEDPAVRRGPGLAFHR